MVNREKLVMFGSAALLVVLGAFVAGFGLRHFHVWPSEDLVALEGQIENYRRFGEWERPDVFIQADVKADEPLARVHRVDDFLRGYRLIMGYDPKLGGYSVRLFDSEAKHIHTWPADYKTFRPDHYIPAGINPHGMEVLPDGSIVVNYDTEAMAIVRIDSCGKPVWLRNDGSYHHSIHLGAGDLLWTWYRPGASDRNLENIVALDVATGEVRQKISLQSVAEASLSNAITMAIPEGFVFSDVQGRQPNVDWDIFHPNDVEPLTASMAAAFPKFKVGDLLISLRNINYVGVLDPVTLELKWGQHGPWVRQHDPDFSPDGRIEIFNNNKDRGRSDLLSIDPTAGDIRRVFAAEENPFYTGSQGKHQKLPNGNYLITVPEEGRVIEVNSEGKTVFEFDNIVRTGVNGRTFNAFWVPENYFESRPSCS